MYGADVAQLRAVAAQFESSAQQLDAYRMSVSSGIQISAWVGPAAVQFRHDWESAHSRVVSNAARRLSDAATALRRNADEQERVSAVDGSAAGFTSLPTQPRAPSWSMLPDIDLNGVDQADLIETILDRIVAGGGAISDLAEWIELERGADPWDLVTNGSKISAVLKGIGIGDAAARLVAGLQDGDWSGTMLAGADGAAVLVTLPGVGIIWGGLSSMTDFFIPLDQAGRDAHIEWAERKGYDLAERYSGLQGFINLGNDNVERKAPWMNDVADNVFEKPAEWLYNIGIVLA